MQALFSDLGLARLDGIVRPGVLCAFDFDGTLAPIVSDPGAARLPPGVEERLLRLSSLTPVAVLTGRSLADIRARLGFEPSYTVGNHGVEGLAGADDLARHEACCRAWRERLEAMLAELAAQVPGIRIEDKRYSLSLHYRAVARQDAAAALLRDLIAQLAPAPRVVAGKCVFNLMPPDSYDKGRALLQLLRRSGAAHAIYVGDDDTDEDVFRMRREEVLSVRVEAKAGSAADFCIPAHADITRLLDELIGRLEAQSSARKGEA